jgi:hypothetical protein
VGHLCQPQRHPQITMVGQAHLRFAERSILIAHQARNWQQLRLSESAFRKHSAVGPQHSLADWQHHCGKFNLMSTPALLHPLYETRAQDDKGCQWS